MAGHVHVPAWLHETRGEGRWPVAAAMVVAIGVQVALPDNLVLVCRWLLPGLELALLIGLIIASPVRFNRESRLLRTTSLILTWLLSLANAWSATVLVIGLVNGQLGQDAGPLLSTGAAIWLTNIIAFAIWYWQFDRGGPAARAHARRTLPDLQFVQMQNPELAHPDWSSWRWPARRRCSSTASPSTRPCPTPPNPTATSTPDAPTSPSCSPAT